MGIPPSPAHRNGRGPGRIMPDHDVGSGTTRPSPCPVPVGRGLAWVPHAQCGRYAKKEYGDSYESGTSFIVKRFAV